MSWTPFQPVTRRRVLQGTAAVAAGSAVARYFHGFPVYASGSTQPGVPGYASAINATLSVAATYNGNLAGNMIGLSISKSQMKKGYFGSLNDDNVPTANPTTVAYFKALGPNGGTLRIGQGSLDTLTWDPTGVLGANGVTPADVSFLAAFLISLGNWQMIYGVNLGAMAPSGNDPGGTDGVLVGSEYPSTPTLVADEVQSLISQLLTQQTSNPWTHYIRGVEIGNEPDLDAWHSGHAYCINSNAQVVITGGGGTGAAATAFVASEVNSVTVTNPGSGYSPAPSVSFTGGGGSGAVATAVLGPVTGLNITSHGTGYTSAPTVIFSGGGGSGAQATATVSGGVVSGITLTKAGKGYTSAPTISFSGGGGSGAAATAVVSATSVAAITMTTKGTGYTSAPTVGFSGGGGTGAQGGANLASLGVVTSIARNSGGSGYTSVPTVTITGSGTGATATATISGGAVTGFTLTAGGSGYNSPACDDTIGTWVESGSPSPWGMEETWEAIRGQINTMMTTYSYGTMPYFGPDMTNISALAANGENAVNPDSPTPNSWVNDFGTDKASELAMLTFHYYPYSDSSTVSTLLQPGGIDPVLIGPNPSSGNPTEPTNGILSNLYSASAGTQPSTHTFGISECNSIGGTGVHQVSDSYAAAFWVIDFIFAIAQGYSGGSPSGGQSGTLACLNGGGPYGCDSDDNCTTNQGNYYSPIYDNGQNTGNIPVGVLPLYYGMTFLAHHCGVGTLYETTVSANGNNVTAYAIHKTATQDLYLVILNKDSSTEWLNMTATVPQPVIDGTPSSFTGATLLQLTQGNPQTATPNLSASPNYSGDGTYGVNIQGATLNYSTGAYTPGTAYTLSTPTPVVGGTQTVSFNVPAYTIVLVAINV